MEEQQELSTANPVGTSDEISRFTESYASFNRIVNSLQRQYLELKDEFAAQNAELVATNRKLVDATRQNLVATEFLNSILTAISAGVVAVDTNGIITHFNPAASLLLGIPERSAVGQHYREVIPPGEPVEANALRTVESGKGLSGIEKLIELEDATRLYVSVSTALLTDDDGAVTGAVEVLHDLTKVKKMEQELARLNTLAALGEMAATIAHEVRNPLTGISGFATLLKRDLGPDDPRQKLVSKICRGVENLNQTVTSLLNYTRFDEVNVEMVDYGDFLRRTVEQFKYDDAELARGSQFNIRSHFGDNAARVCLSCDPMLLRQLFYSIFTNAIEACDGSARVELVYRKHPRQKAAQMFGDRMILSLEETVVETTISDNGPGLSEEARERLFAPFFTTKAEGNGLGLAMAWKVIKAHGGDLMADSKPGGGAVFRVLLPARIDTAEPQNEWAMEQSE